MAGSSFAYIFNMAFTFEKLIVYQKSLQFVEAVEYLRKSKDRKNPHSLMDQLFRAALSIPLNIAEGNGRWHKGDKRNFFWIARGSIFECVPLIQLLHRSGYFAEEEYKLYYSQLEMLSKMTTRLVQSIEN